MNSGLMKEKKIWQDIPIERNILWMSCLYKY